MLHTLLGLQFMIPKFYREFIDDLTQLVTKKFIPMSRIDDAVKRILWVKFVMGLFENPFADYSLVRYLGIQVSYFFSFCISFKFLKFHN